VTEATNRFALRTLIALGLAAFLFLLWRSAYALLLGFGAVLFAVFLRGAAGPIARWTGISMRLSVGAVCLLLVAAAALGGWLVGPLIAEQLDELGSTFSTSIEQLRASLERTIWGKRILDVLTGMGSDGTVATAAAKFVMSAVDAVLGVILVVVAGAYLAMSPRDYMEGLVYLLPKHRHQRAREVFRTTGSALWLWMRGQLITMAIVGVLTGVTLMLIGVPLAIALGLIAGLAEFVPFIGPLLAAVPILVVALAKDPQIAMYALLAVVVVQQLESNLITPLIQRHAVELPPVMVLVGTIAFSLLLGILGLIFAAPLLVVVMVWTKMLYMQDALEERVSVPGARSAA
jgi:predicted PurR-regulated permease PerM